MIKRTLISAILTSALLTMQAQTLTLDSCLHLAQLQATDIQIAQLETQKAQEVKKQAFTKYFPQVRAMGGGMYALQPLFVYGIDDLKNQQIRNALQEFFRLYGEDLNLKSEIELFQKGYMASVTALQPVFFGGQIFNSNRLAKLNIEAKQLQEKIQQRQTLRQVEEQYWLVVSLKEKQKVVDAARQLLDTATHTLDAAVSAGLSLSVDQVKLKARHSDLQLQSLRLQHGIELATQALAITLGLDTIDVADTLNLSTIQDPQQYADYSPREEDQLLDIQVRAKDLEKKIAIGQALPQLAVGATYSYNNLVRSSHNGIFFLTLQVPLTDWWETSHKIRQHNIDIQQAQLQQTDLTRMLRLQHHKRYLTLIETIEALRQADDIVSAANETYRLTELNYRVGLSPVRELLEAQTELVDAKTKQVDTYIQYRLALSDLQ